MNISGSFFLPQHITMRIALGEVSFQSEAITRRHCLWKYFSGAFLGILLKIIWFKPSDLLAIFVSNGQAKTPRPFPKAICTSFLNTISKSVVCFQVLNLWLLCYQMAIIIIIKNQNSWELSLANGFLTFMWSDKKTHWTFVCSKGSFFLTQKFCFWG